MNATTSCPFCGERVAVLADDIARRHRAGGSRMSDNWTDIPGYEGLYQASEAGLIRSIRPHFRAPIVMRTHPSGRGGYPCLTILDAAGTPKQIVVHKLILLTFLGPSASARRDGNRRCRTCTRKTGREGARRRKLAARAVDKHLDDFDIYGAAS